MIDKQKALELREQGKTYDEISVELDCSVAWCKKNLKGIKRKDISEEDYMHLVDKGRSYDCITRGEIAGKVVVRSQDNYDKYCNEVKLSTNRVKRKLTKEGDVIVRQAWIHPARARFSYENMLRCINDLNDTLDEYVRMHLLECGFENDDQYKATLAFMVMNSQYGQLVQRNYSAGVFEAIDKAVNDIEERNGSADSIVLEPKEYPFITKDELPY